MNNYLGDIISIFICLWFIKTYLLHYRMTKEEALEALSSIFAEVLDEKDIELDYQMTANDVDRWDSITNMTIISEIESRFNIKLKLREIIKLKNVGALCDAIVSKSK